MPLTKTDCINFVRNKKSEEINKIHAFYKSKIYEQKENILNSTGMLPKINEIQNQFTLFINSYDMLINSLSDINNIEYKRGEYYSFEYKNRDLSKSKDSLINQILSSCNFPDNVIEKLQDELKKKTAECEEEYSKVESILKTMSTPKRCLEFLKKWNFDISVLENIQNEMFYPLTTPIDISKLRFKLGD